MDCGHQFHRLPYKIKYQQFIREEHTDFTWFDKVHISMGTKVQRFTVGSY